MSLIVGYVSKDCSMIMSDGRALGAHQSETYDKTFTLGNHTIGGFCGIMEDIEIVMPDLKASKFDNTEEIAYFIEYELKEKPEHISFNSSIVMVGLDSHNQLCKFLIGHLTNYKVEKVCTVNKPVFFTIGGSIPSQKINNIFTSVVHNEQLTSFGKLKETIFEVSKIDPSVNNQCFYRKMVNINDSDIFPNMVIM
ncbi:hypothetical protein QUW58_23265 [Enterocloster aldenensis]|uniref:hypothetical protein n=1 Tax=Enterocloster aldenensis TaxID=358742 RepID=UPI0025A38149|nr:hypothetical protein [Enterocloster aldenensis]